MEAQAPETVKTAGSSKDTVFLLASTALVIGGLWAFYYFDPQFNALVRTLMLLAALGASLAAAYQTALGRELWGYIIGSRSELRKVIWPTRQESLQATLMIAVIVVIFAMVLGGIDWLLNIGVRALTGRGES